MCERCAVHCAGQRLQDLTKVPEILYAEPDSIEAQEQLEVVLSQAVLAYDPSFGLHTPVVHASAGESHQAYANTP